MVTEFWFFMMLVFHPVEGRTFEVHAYTTEVQCIKALAINANENDHVPGFRISPGCAHIKARPGEFDLLPDSQPEEWPTDREPGLNL